MKEQQKNVPTGEKILSLLVDLLADQYGVKVKYQIIKRGAETDERTENDES